MRRTFLATLCFGILAGCIGLSSPAIAKRVALVIGNDAYQAVAKLKKAVNDANAMAATLSDIGFEVISATNVTRRELNQKLLMFSAQLKAGDEALFFYAGHGVEIAGRNYLLPIDIPNASPGQEDFVTAEAIAVDQVLGQIKRRGTRVSILILDACRDNPFSQGDGRSIGSTRGLARSFAPKGTFIMYSAGVGQLALDRLQPNDPSPNSVFTRSLIPLIKQPGMSLVLTARQVRRDVEKLAGTVLHEQRPAYYDEVTGDFFFAKRPTLQILPGKTPDVAVAAVPAAKVAPAAPQTRTSSVNQTAQAWDTIKNISNPEILETFINEAPDSAYAAFAKARLNELLEQPAPVSQPTVIARVEPSPTPEEAPAIQEPSAPAVGSKIDKKDLATRLQKELNRIGCSAGRPDGKWGKNSRSAVKSYIRHGSHDIASLEPNADLLRLLIEETARICPLICSGNQILKNGECTAKTCPAGQSLTKWGKCYTPKKNAVTSCANGQRRNSKGRCYIPKKNATKSCASGQRRSSQGKCYTPKKKAAKSCASGQRRSSSGKCYTSENTAAKSCRKGQYRTSKGVCFTPRKRMAPEDDPNSRSN